MKILVVANVSADNLPIYYVLPILTSKSILMM